MELLSTSGIVLLVCVLAGLYLVSRRMKPQGTAAIGAEKYAADVIEESHEQSLKYESNTFGQAGTNTSVELVPYALVPRWGRLTIFALACCALLVALVTGVMSVVGSVSFILPLTCGLGAACALGFLRILAIHDRDLRRVRTALTVEKTRKAQRSPNVREAQGAPGAVPSVDTSSLELRHVPELPARARKQIPVSHAAKALRQARTRGTTTNAIPKVAPPATESPVSEAPSRLRMDEALPTTTWQVTEVPRPTYLDASVVHRDVPVPEPSEPERLSQTETLAEAASLNLDDVLKRRRA